MNSLPSPSPSKPLVRAAAGVLVLSCLALAGYVALSTPRPEAPPPAPVAEHSTGKFEKNGAVVELSVTHPVAPGEAPPPLMEGDTVQVRFRLSDATSHEPLRGLSPSAWMDLGQVLAGKPQEKQECRERVALYLKGLPGIRPLVDLNSYYLLVMNQDASISVIDPLVGMTGKTSLYATVLLDRPGADWVKSRDGRRLFVSMPRAGQVAVVDTESFRLVGQVEAGPEPTRVALQPDGRYLWVGDGPRAGARSGVTVIALETLKPVARIPTGRGHHELAFSAEDRFAFVSNRESGTVSVIDIAQLRTVKELRTGPLPISLAYSSLSQALYVADAKEGTVIAIDGTSLEERARLTVRPGLGPLRMSPDGRWALVLNPTERTVYVIDSASHRLAHTLSVDGQPYQLSFTRGFAYVRLLDSERVQMINLSTLGTESKPAVQSFAAGTAAPQLAGDLSLADSVTPASTEAAVFVTSPAENTSYFYMEGMNAPMGSFGNYGHAARAVTVVDRSLRELEPGLYATSLRLPAAGRYDVAFLLDSPRVLHCFSLEVKENPELRQALGGLELVYRDLPTQLALGETPRLRFQVLEAATRKPLAGLSDVKVLTYAAPGRLRTEVPAEEVEEGLYEASPSLPSPGAYYVYVSVPSRQVNYGGLPYRTLWVTDTKQRPSPQEETSHVSP